MRRNWEKYNWEMAPPKADPNFKIDMIKNYFKIAWRNLVKNKAYSFINIEIRNQKSEMRNEK